MEKTYYQLLAVPCDASPADIRRAFRRQARQCHPDTATFSAADETHFQQLLTAYRLLNSPSKRARYDAQLAKSHSALNSFWWRIWRGFFRLRWQRLQAYLSCCVSSPSVKSTSVRYHSPPIETWSRDPSCWPSFSQVLAARQKVESSCYVLCEDGIIRPKSEVREREQSRPLPVHRPNLTVVLRGWWGVLLVLMVGCWEVFKR